VPAGCLTFIALGVAFVAAIIVFVFSAMKTSDSYKMAVARAKADSRVADVIGTPVEEGWIVSGSTNVNGASGQSDLAIPIHGPKGAAKIYLSATKSAGQWRYSKLIVTFDETGKTIDLIDPASEEEEDD
jgi:cytochrome oxidase complex assembly protein 1